MSGWRFPLGMDTVLAALPGAPGHATCALEASSACIRACAADVGISLPRTRLLGLLRGVFKHVEILAELHTKPARCKVVALGPAAES